MHLNDYQISLLIVKYRITSTWNKKQDDTQLEYDRLRILS